MAKLYIFTILLIYIQYTIQRYCGSTNPTNTNDCLADSDRQNICCLATFYQAGNFTKGDKKKVCVSTFYNSSYVGKRSIVGFDNNINAIYDCNQFSDYTSFTESQLTDNFYGVPYCSTGPNTQSEFDCFNSTIPSMADCCYINGTINIYRATINYRVCLKTDLNFNNTDIANNMFSNLNGGKLTCRDPLLLNVSKTINFGIGVSRYLILSLFSIICYVFFILD